MARPASRTVHVVDDDAAVRRTLEFLLSSAGFTSVSYASSADFLAVAPKLTGCVLLDVRMPGLDGLETQMQLVGWGVFLPVIMMTGQGDVQTAVRAMKAGAVDFIEKPFDDEALIGAVRAALAQDVKADRERDAKRAAELMGRLSVREREVLEALVAGQQNKMIAFNLGISVRTVEVHRARMMERLGVRQLASAIRLAVLAALSASG